MVSRHHLLAAGAALALALFHPVAAAQADALTGTVTSAEEGAMEGVLVSAKREGSNKTITVVSDEKGRYRFPAARLEPGKYTITIRADRLRPRRRARAAGHGQGRRDRGPEAGQDEGPRRRSSRTPSGSTARPARRSRSGRCSPASAATRSTRSRARRHDADGFVTTIQRMGTYANQSTFINPQKRLTGRDTDVVGEERAQAAADERRVLRLHQPEHERERGERGRTS